MRVVILGGLLGASTVACAFSHNIMLTGYWPPTNEMLRQFSINSDQNATASAAVNERPKSGIAVEHFEIRGGSRFVQEGFVYINRFS